MNREESQGHGKPSGRVGKSMGVEAGGLAVRPGSTD